MTYTQKQIDKIIELRQRQNMGPEKIAKELKLSKNPVKKYLRLYGLLPYSYPSYQQARPPSLCYPTHSLTSEIDQLKEKVEIKELNLRIEQMKSESEKDKELVQQLIKENENLNNEKTQMTNEQVHVNGQNQKIIQEYQKKLEELTKSLSTVYALHIKYKEKIEEEHSEQVQKLNDERTVLENTLSGLKKKNTEITDERDRYKKKVTELERDKNNAWIYNLLSFVGGAGVGIVGHTIYQKITSRSPLPQRVEPGNNTRYYASPIMGTMETHTSGIQCSGTIIANNRENTPTVDNVPSNQRQSTIPTIQPLNGVTQEIITSGIPCSGASWNNYGGNTCSGFVKNPNQPESIPPYTYCEITNGTSIPGDQSSRFYSSSHVETIGFTPQNATPAYLHSPSQIPWNYISQYIPLYPLPSELSGINLWIPIMKMSGHQFEAFIQWVFEQLGYTVTRMKKTHDKGGDILLEGFGERIIIQVRHRKEHTGIGALQAVIFAKKIYGATKARVISISPFTADAIRDAPKAEIELWDLEQLLTELRNHCIYYPTE